MRTLFIIDKLTWTLNSYVCIYGNYRTDLVMPGFTLDTYELYTKYFIGSSLTAYSGSTMSEGSSM